MYADRITESMQQCIDETARRREVQRQHNTEHGIVPRSTTAALTPLEADAAPAARGSGRAGSAARPERALPVGLAELRDGDLLPEEIPERIESLRARMRELAAELRYEDAAKLRDRVRVLEARQLEFT